MALQNYCVPTIGACRWDAIMADITGGMFGDAEYFKPLVDGVNDMTVSVIVFGWEAWQVQ